MNQTLKKVLAITLATLMLLTAAPLADFTEIDLPDIDFGFTAKAATQGDFDYSVSNGEAQITAYTGSAEVLAIPSELGGYPVTSIGDSAFLNCDSLTSITIPDSVTSIEYSAFSDCINLTSVHISDIAAWCGIEFGNSYSNPLWRAKKLYLNDELVTDLVIPDGVTSIGDYAFYRCSNLTSITIPDSVTSIGDYAFYFCDSLTSITIPDSVTGIGSSAFYGTAYYDDANNWVNNVLYIGNHLIIAKTELSGAYTVKEGTKTIADVAFSGCTSLTSVTIPDSVTSIGYNAFGNCTSLTSVIIGDSVTSIGDSAFRRCNSLTSITIPDSVTSIGNYAFENCTSLTSVTIPNSVTSIGSAVFYGTAYYDDTNNWENNVLYIGNHLIEAKTELSGTYAVKEGTKTIADDAFYNCDSLTSVTIPDSVTSIGSYAFSGCTSLTSITIPDSVTSIDWYAFEDCTSLTSITIPDSVTSIGDYAFEDCTSLTSVTIPNSVTSIGGSAFEDCTSLTSVTIPDSVTSIGDWAFYSCSSLTSVTILNPNCAVYDSSDTITSTATIYGYDNSTAQEYAEKYSRTFVSLSTAPEDRFDGTTAFVKDNALIGLADTTVQNILQQAGNGAKLTKADGTAKKADEKIGTGDKLVLPDGTEMILSVLGDLNGDGEIATSDARLALRKAVNLETFTEAQNTAACVDGGAVVEVAHARKILRASVNLEKAEDWFKILAK